jgi:hypothetical protein
MNSYVMDGILYNQQVGTTSVSLTSNATWSYGSTNVTNLEGFTEEPYVLLAAEHTNTTGPAVAHFNVTGTTSMTVYAFRAGATTGPLTIRWLAVQATPSNPAGS